MVPDPVDPLEVRLAVAHPGEDVDLVPLPLEGRGQIGDVDTDPTDGDRMEGLP
jgi:hypothetical protein